MYQNKDKSRENFHLERGGRAYRRIKNYKNQVLVETVYGRHFKIILKPFIFQG
jgi:O-acetylhomoserine/O-acetylserine sulfhydrylase-like pyridoxal-dependent enzyme